MNREAIERVALEALQAVLEEIETSVPASNRSVTAQTVVFGPSGRLDSLGLVRFVVLVEERLQERLGMAVTLVDERAMSQSRSPFRSVERLVEYISTILGEASRA